MSEIKIFKGGRRTEDAASDLAERIRAEIYANATGISVAAIVGVLELVKMEVLVEQVERERER